MLDAPRLAKRNKDGSIIRSSGFDLEQLAKERVHVRKVFKNSWANAQYGFGDQTGGVFQRTRIGPADLIMTDGRHFRGIEGPFLGDPQMAWLEHQPTHRQISLEVVS